MNDRYEGDDRQAGGAADLEERRARRRERASQEPRHAEARRAEREAGFEEAGRPYDARESGSGEAEGSYDRRPGTEVAGEESGNLLPTSESERFRARWKDIQTGFVDSPRQAVQEADTLVADVLDRIQDVFTSERESLEGQWHQGDEVSTEDLRQGLRRYRAFFDRLLSL